MRYSLCLLYCIQRDQEKPARNGKPPLRETCRTFSSLGGGGVGIGGGSVNDYLQAKKSDQWGAKCSSEMINDPIDEQGTPQQEKLPLGSPPEMKCAHSFGCVPFFVFETKTP